MPFERTPSIDAVIEVAKSAVTEHPYRQVRLVMYAPDSGQTRLQRVQRGTMIQLRDRGYYPLGLLGW